MMHGLLCPLAPSWDPTSVPRPRSLGRSGRGSGPGATPDHGARSLLSVALRARAWVAC